MRKIEKILKGLGFHGKNIIFFSGKIIQDGAEKCQGFFRKVQQIYLGWSFLEKISEIFFSGKF